MMRMMTLIGLLAALSFTSACNTMKGAGQDMQEGGQNLERSAKENGADQR